MKYYAHFWPQGFNLVPGVPARPIKQYFSAHDECVSNDFSLSKGGKDLQLFNSDNPRLENHVCRDGHAFDIGQRLKAVEKYLVGEKASSQITLTD